MAHRTAMLVSRVCHDLVSPVGAVMNGLEILEDEPDASMRADAMRLVNTSAEQAAARLQFARIDAVRNDGNGILEAIATKIFRFGRTKGVQTIRFVKIFGFEQASGQFLLPARMIQRPGLKHSVR